MKKRERGRNCYSTRAVSDFSSLPLCSAKDAMALSALRACAGEHGWLRGGLVKVLLKPRRRSCPLKRDAAGHPSLFFSLSHHRLSASAGEIGAVRRSAAPASLASASASSLRFSLSPPFQSSSARIGRATASSPKPAGPPSRRPRPLPALSGVALTKPTPPPALPHRPGHHRPANSVVTATDAPERRLAVEFALPRSPLPRPFSSAPSPIEPA